MHKNAQKYTYTSKKYSKKILTDILTYFNIYNIISLINLNKPEQIINLNKTHNATNLNNTITQLLTGNF